MWYRVQLTFPWRYFRTKRLCLAKQKSVFQLLGLSCSREHVKDKQNWQQRETDRDRETELQDWLRHTGGLLESRSYRLAWTTEQTSQFKKNMYFIICYLFYRKITMFTILAAVFASICIKFCFHYDHRVASWSLTQYIKTI